MNSVLHIPLGRKPFINITCHHNVWLPQLQIRSELANYFTQARQADTAVVVTQLTNFVYEHDIPFWIGSDLFIYLSLITVLCCLVFGIVATIFACELRKMLQCSSLSNVWMFLSVGNCPMYQLKP